MDTKDAFNKVKGVLSLIILAYTLFACTEVKPNLEDVMDDDRGSTTTGIPPSVTPSPTTEILPTRTLDLFRPDTVRETYAAEATRDALLPSSTPKPSPTPTKSPQELCQPFPDDVRYLGSARALGYETYTIQAQCHGETAYFRSPVGDMTFFYYTPLRGRFAYGPADDEENGLWVYDYWIDHSEKWLNEKVIAVQWAPVNNTDGDQSIAILNQDGVLSIATQPFQFHPLVEDVSYFSFAPTADQIAYVKKNVLYVLSLDSGQARKLAENAYGTPVWAIQENAIIFPSSPFKIVKLDGSGAFVPQEMQYITKKNTDYGASTQILWDDKGRILVFHNGDPNDDASINDLFVYELSQDLHSIINQERFIANSAEYIYWEYPGQTIVDSAGHKTHLTHKADTFNVIARITSISDDSLGIEFYWEDIQSSSGICLQFSRAFMSDQTQILDKLGNTIPFEMLKKGMIMTINARMLASHTLSLFIYKMQVECDEEPCYLGMEGCS